MISKTFIAIGAVLALAVVGLSVTGAGPAAGDAICQDRLGDEWAAGGIAQHPDWDRWHVKCERDTGILTSESQWVDIRPAEWPESQRP